MYTVSKEYKYNIVDYKTLAVIGTLFYSASIRSLRSTGASFFFFNTKQEISRTQQGEKGLAPATQASPFEMKGSRVLPNLVISRLEALHCGICDLSSLTWHFITN